MKSNNDKKKYIISSITSVILAVLLIVSIVLGCGVYFGGWFGKSSGGIKIAADLAEDQTEDKAENMYITTGVSTGKLSIDSSRTVASTASSSVEYVSDSYTLTATYNTDASNPTFTWSSSDTSNITITPSSDTISCVVKCNSAFSTQVTIKCTANDNSSVYATCTVDYIKRATDASFTLANSYGSNISFSSSGSSAEWVIPADDWNDNIDVGNDIYTNYGFSYSSYSVTATGTGTLSETYTIGSVELGCTSLYNSGYAYTDYSGILAGTATNTYYYKSYLLSMYHTSTSNLNWVKYSTYRNATYNYMQSAYSAGVGMDVKLIITGDITGLSYSFTYNLLANPVNLYTSVSSLSLSQEAIAF